MKIKSLICVLGLVAAVAVLSQTKPSQTTSKPQSPSAQKLEPKAPPPTNDQKQLGQAYGATKQYCCQLPNGCISGPRDGSKVCKELGGTPFSNSYCAAAPKQEKKKAGVCVDP